MAQTQPSQFSKAVVTAMRKLYPEQLADKSFDNTGLLLEAPHNEQAKLKNRVLLTIDLTKAVTEEAIQKRCGAIVAYHPIIFRGLKSLTFMDTQQSSLLRLAAEGISVYSPHTAVDAARGGNADWLANIVTGNPSQNIVQLNEERSKTDFSARQIRDFDTDGYSTNLYTFPSAFDVHEKDISLANEPHSRKPIVLSANDNQAGMGRIVNFQKPQDLDWIIWRLTWYLGGPDAFSIAMPQGKESAETMINKIGICAGSGGSLLNDVEDLDLLLTGELSHHEALAATENGKVVVCLGHSNSERGYLSAVMRVKLLNALKADNTISADDVEVEVSEKDRDPYLTMLRRKN